LISKANIAYQFPELTKKGKKTRHNSPGNRGV
jgi:hypothetical protein